VYPFIVCTGRRPTDAWIASIRASHRFGDLQSASREGGKRQKHARSQRKLDGIWKIIKVADTWDDKQKLSCQFATNHTTIEAASLYDLSRSFFLSSPPQ
jgi:hypothetical protein